MKKRSYLCKEAFQLSPVQFLMVFTRSEKPIRAWPRPFPEKFPSVAFVTVASGGMTDVGLFSSFRGRSSSAFSSCASLLRAIDCIVSALVLRRQNQDQSCPWLADWAERLMDWLTDWSYHNRSHTILFHHIDVTWSLLNNDWSSDW